MNIDKRVSAALFNIFNEHSSILSAYYELGDEEAVFCIEFKENSPIFLYCPFGDLWFISDVLIKGKRQVRQEELKSSCMMLGLKEDLVTMLVYKLGQEVVAPSRNKELLKGSSVELNLQREMSKYLIERGIVTYGLTFGRSQVDLYMKERNSEDFVIEVKVYKTRINTSSIKANFVQLQSYMDQHYQPRGILVIFNFTNDLISSPRKWIRGRYWILAINLCESSPSKRNRTIIINESSDSSDIIVCTDFDSKANSKPKRKKARTRK